MRSNARYLAFIFLLFLACSAEQEEQEQRVLESYLDERQTLIGRGLVALNTRPNEVFLTWRFLPGDRAGTSFLVFRSEVGDKAESPRLLAETRSTSFLDSNADGARSFEYVIQPRSEGALGASSAPASPSSMSPPKGALSYDVGDYKQVRVVTGDLDGDGEREVVIQYSKNPNVDPQYRSVDPSRKPSDESKHTIKVAAFQHTGERMWTFDLGWGIEAGVNYSPLVVWDLDADGRAEVILKTNSSGDPLDYSSDRLTILDGVSGETKSEAIWPTEEGLHADYNSNSRNSIAIAHLDGRRPYVITIRGLYKTQRLWAYDSELNRVWERIIGRNISSPFERLGRGWRFHLLWRRYMKGQDRGSHTLPIADVNDDGKEEIMWGEHCIGEHGEDLWVVEERMPYYGHPDIVVVADILASNPGKEIYYAREGWGEDAERIGVLLMDNKGNPIWTHWGYTHVDGGWVSRIVPQQEGLQCFAFDITEKIFREEGIERIGTTQLLWNSAGELITELPKSWIKSFPVDWDGDLIHEICLESGLIQEYDGSKIAELGPGVLWAGDIFGDHREEVVTAPGGGSVFVLFNTERLQNPPSVTRGADRQYRNDLSRTISTVVPMEGGFTPTYGQDR